MLTTMLKPLPSIVLPPLALLWRGLGWSVFRNRNEFDTARISAGLIAVILVGLLVEDVVFRRVEARTVVRGGTVR